MNTPAAAPLALPAGDPDTLWSRHGEAITTLICAAFVLAGWSAANAGVPGWCSASLFLVAYAVGGYRQAIEGCGTLVRERELDVDLLMVVAAIGAAAIGYWADGALLIFIFALSGTLEGYASKRTKRDIQALVALRPEEATVVDSTGAEVTVAARSLVPDDIVIIRPGSRIAADGEVVDGHSSVNQATITGESMPVDKGIGELRVRVTHAASETVLARIILLVEQAEQRRPPAQLFIERFERHYAKVVVAGAIAITFLPPLLLGWTFRAALYRSMIFLVVASPCALAAAMMPALLSALSNGARSGVLFKGSTFIEAIGRIQVVIFDKTGTLTTGMPRVTDILAFEGTDASLLATAAAVESLSEHPLARAIVREATRRGLAFASGTAHQSLPGKGAHAEVDGSRWSVGTAAMFEDLPPAVRAARAKLEAEGKTVVIVGDASPRGLIALRDTLRAESREAISQLRGLGVAHLVMLTGDSEPTARAIGKEAGIDEIHAGLLPDQKVRIVEDLVCRYGHVAMVGDGVNDAPALAAASVGIAMGAAGTDVALETADVVLTADDLLRLPYAIVLGRRALAVVKQNLIFALGVIVSLVVADLFGRINLPMGVVGHEGSTLLVTVNGLRLLRRVRTAT
jgi:Cd2+/Zn2+-exporting ATPase